MLKTLIIGHAGHGKDTVADILQKSYGYKGEDSSRASLRIFLFDILQKRYGYATPEEAYQDRVNHRGEWYNEICEYNKDDKARLGRAIMADNDIYIGMRSHDEIRACKGAKLFDIVIGVFDPRKPLEPESSFSIDLWKEADVVLVNNGTISKLERSINLLKFL
jgi:hypothetical protein